MSHFTDVELEIKDLQALEDACKEMGFELVRNTTARYYYGSKQADIVIKLSGKYDMTVEKSENGYKLQADWYDGHVARCVGQNADLLKQNYATHVAMRMARKKGYRVQRRNLQNGKVELILGVR
jgi:hypothetical protein